ncbi:hypothetical protein BDC45DRAFT_514304 [Circinella umbellata]|nr:hypothetical protein BDC45DRAFT_514304 [Circinella umbellata]
MAEVANHSRTTSSKLYNDKLKSVLASKCHLNTLLNKLDNLNFITLQGVYIPIVQILGLSVAIHTLSIIDKNFTSYKKLQNSRFLVHRKKFVRAGLTRSLLNFLNRRKW